jgi:hypothetical protein
MPSGSVSQLLDYGHPTSTVLRNLDSWPLVVYDVMLWLCFHWRVINNGTLIGVPIRQEHDRQHPVASAG